MKKGVSTIIVVILLLLITISLVGFVFIFFQRSLGGATEQTQQQQEQLQQALGKQLRIDNVAAQAVTVRHTGTVAIPTSEVTVYVNSTAVSGGRWEDVAGNAITTIALGTVVIFDFTGPPVAVPNSCALNGQIKVTTPAGSVTDTC